MFIITLILKITSTIKFHWESCPDCSFFWWGGGDGSSCHLNTWGWIVAQDKDSKLQVEPGVEQQLSRVAPECMFLRKMCFNWQKNTGEVSATHPRTQAHVSVSLSRHCDLRPALPQGCSCLRFGQLCFKKTNTGVDGQHRQNCWDWPKRKHACQNWLAVKQEVDWSAVEMNRKTIASAEWTPWQSHPYSVLLYYYYHKTEKWRNQIDRSRCF